MRRILGTGQGSGASPCIWISILDITLWPMTQIFQCFYLESQSGTKVKRLGDALLMTRTYVVWRRQIQKTSAKPTPGEELYKEMWSIAQDFERKFISNGRELVLQKFVCFLVVYICEKTYMPHQRLIHNIPPGTLH